ncbi:MAG: M1 family metallopeptidase [Candidatus Micrarchaeaceae archaeon]
MRLVLVFTMARRHYACIPRNYSIALSFGWDPEEFDGEVTIDVDISKPVSSVRLDADMISVKSAAFLAGGKMVEAKYSTGNGYLKIAFGKRVSGNCKICIAYRGKVRNDMNGLFKQRYTDNGSGSYILATQLESVFARSVFPCFDDPALKATFELSVIAPRGMHVVSNMPEKLRKPYRGYTLTKFKRTPKMSTYLLFVAVGNFGRRTYRYGKTKVGILARKEKVHLINNSIGMAARVLDFFSRYLGIKYPLPKIDFIAIPGFNAAMENWGAIASGERDILYDKKYASIYQLQNISDTIAHELAHQWFGNLVTTSSWGDLWLNESFADLMSHKALDNIFPEWNIRTEYAIDLFNAGAFSDSVKNTHPISSPDSSLKPEDMFDAISYNKGYLVLRMVEHYIGSEKFLAGIRSYLRKNAYSNATPDDLISSIQAECSSNSETVGNIMHSWLSEQGIPLVKARMANGRLRLSKLRFLIDGTKSSGNWVIPVGYLDSNGVEGYAILQNSASIKVSGSWTLLNHMHSGFYRVAYDAEQLKLLGMEIQRGGLEALDAFGIENDLYALTRAGHYKIRDYLDFVGRYCDDPDPYTARDIMVNFLDIVSLCGTRLPKKLERRILLHAKASLEVQRKRPNSVPGIMLLSSTLELLGSIGDRESVGWAKRMVRIALRGNWIKPDIRATAYFVAARSGNMGFENAKKLYESAKSAAERAEIVYAMGLLGGIDLSRALDYLAAKGFFYEEQLALKAAFSSSSTSREGLIWLEANWSRLKKKFAADSSSLQFIIGYIKCISSEEDLALFRKFFKKKVNDSASDRYAIENVDSLSIANIKFVNRIAAEFR